MENGGKLVELSGLWPSLRRIQALRPLLAGPAGPQPADQGQMTQPLTDDDLPFWKRNSMKDMSPSEWESLCAGCGRCCLNKLMEEGTERTYYTDVGCRLLDGQACRCKDYQHRAAQVDDCVQLSPRN